MSWHLFLFILHNLSSCFNLSLKALCMYVSLNVFVQNEVNRIEFTKALYAVSLLKCFASLLFCFVLLYLSFRLTISTSHRWYASLISHFCVQQVKFLFLFDNSWEVLYSVTLTGWRFIIILLEFSTLYGWNWSKRRAAAFNSVFFLPSSFLSRSQMRRTHPTPLSTTRKRKILRMEPTLVWRRNLTHKLEEGGKNEIEKKTQHDKNLFLSF